MSNGIRKRQNTDYNIARLAAQRQLYSDVGVVDTVNLILSVVIPLCFAIVQEVMTEWTWAKTASCFLSIAMFVISLFLSSVGRRKRELAASIQQEFDVDVYQMPWDDKLFGSKKDLNNEIAGASKRILNDESEKKALYDWYTPAVDTLPKNLAIATCQKENFTWDAGLRRRYRMLNIVVLALVIILPITVCLIKGQTVQELLFKFIMVLPACKWLVSIISGLNDDLKRMEPLERSVYSTDEKTLDQLKFTQRDIFQNRKAAVKVPNWFYGVFKDNDEDRERRAVEFGKRG